MTKVSDKVMLTGEVHPAADVFPMLTDTELQELADDIRANGLIYPIVVDSDGRLIDGRNRLTACNLAGVEPRFETLSDGTDVVSYILSTNISRRHLTKGQQAMAIARAFLLSKRGEQGQAAKDHGVSQARVSQAATVLEYAPELADGVMAGAPLNDAYEVARARKVEAEARAADSRAAAEVVEMKLARVREQAPDLLELISNEKRTLEDALRELAERERSEIERARAERDRISRESAALARAVSYAAQVIASPASRAAIARDFDQAASDNPFIVDRETIRQASENLAALVEAW